MEVPVFLALETAIPLHHHVNVQCVDQDMNPTLLNQVVLPAHITTIPLTMVPAFPALPEHTLHPMDLFLVYLVNVEVGSMELTVIYAQLENTLMGELVFNAQPIKSLTQELVIV